MTSLLTGKTLYWRGRSSSSLVPAAKVAYQYQQHPLRNNMNASQYNTGLITSGTNEKLKMNKREAKQLDAISRGRLVQDGFVYRENILVRSFDVGGDSNMSPIALMNHLQDTALNHARMIGLLSDGFGSTPEMSKIDLIWVVCSLDIQIDRYPSWGDVVQVDTCMYPSGKNGLGRDWILTDANTNQTLASATSVFAIMNKKTRKLSKMTEEIREEIKPFSINCDPVLRMDSRKIPRLEVDTASYVCTGLKPGWNDVDVNDHVSFVKYMDWIIEVGGISIGHTFKKLAYKYSHRMRFQGIPSSFAGEHELLAMSLKYRKECFRNSSLQSLSKMVENNSDDHSVDDDLVVEFVHLLCPEDGTEIMRGSTLWKPKDAGKQKKPEGSTFWKPKHESKQKKADVLWDVPFADEILKIHSVLPATNGRFTNGCL
ncbi:hypothetical protein Tsubulata_025725 [Turnera subulata]|uniref:Acyl-[acyl-carrier-protein] hydrolase n=1 Tax=Turnera subulata TaxID=218843 RepID=A0A9Q0FRU0_9ROSI|nr:hypothetical protein Tsubulata_025725 [Turnera subulata]